MDVHTVLFPNGVVSINDLLTTVGAVGATVVAWRQREKDKQIANRDADIQALRDEITLLRAELNTCYEKRAELLNKTLG